ncbi:MAG: ABC transporter, ATP-binding protein (cluster 10, nitrate/sulfonate/bicarbonate) [uncultured Craurococcus sp.]|uniref:ABC transporter, ATP-binding protein (Cluster 10, nitrate/sulfonate/bicarbonate) n=1 Tax=uncultured Craurococcus sp. TaxID=1135998 RepID=A0A6J4JRI0_9PROT|nr:MAG: ABC transporter, ATP-binding protein (cluster 10, nitrate/sulfonate/bicarbonate) [uncultured Craurococcus sp.]
MTLVALDGVGKRFASGTEALRDVDLRIEPGEFLSLLGPSGCGKSTLLRLIAGLAEPSAGRIERAASRQVGFVFQEATLLPWSDAVTNVRLPLRLLGLPRAEQEERAAEALAQVGLGGFERAYPRELSGGMRMRVSIARALVTRPSLLLMDEPFAALDELTRHRLNDDLLALWAGSGVTVVFVTHSVFESVYLSSRILVMAARPGRIAAEVVVEAPRGEGSPRPEGFRTSAEYAALCRRATEALEGAMRA